MLSSLRSALLIVGVSVLLFGVSAQQDPPETTTVKPTTTTPAPTTPPTTPAPAPTTTTAKPAPAPKYPGNDGKWTLENANNETCIIIKGAIEVSITYLDVEKKNRTANVDIPIKGVTVSGNCSLGVIKLTWTVVTNHTNSVEFTFEKNETASITTDGISAGKYALQNVTGTLYKDPAVFVNATNPNKDFTFNILDKAAFQTPFNHSYSCLQQETLKSEDGFVTLKLTDMRLDAFRKTGKNDTNFNPSIDCPADDASDVVPIAVGAALAGLVVIVLIAYLIGRRRSRSRGYQSV
ncbi:lysosome-associated membrane glycoprotein 1 [Folsomia candida]|uniref:Lysosome-associated membrane glycoprotein 5 n=1 Tax=Folsomia candida TaxID=158441 RepID=A0A226E1G1_FOLCA|nr:lysosome-associated membrane glycoprotein 1 [Folsomia candida]XP_021955607.1 lysosome-associated membrane glycoprotein 1 [Folsomia candida]OXA51562.1 Lysosome-associated membrane glycoprotein 1 [Folsomia candida]